VPVTDDDILTQGGVVALVGPTGVGKTTTVAKLAARYSLRHGSKRVALVTTDCYRIGAHEQLRTYGRILDVPVRVTSDETELRTVLQSLADKSLVLIDTAGMGQRDLRLSEHLALINSGLPRIRTYLVLGATAQMSGMEEIVSAFQGAKLTGCIATKVDETTRLGGLLSVVIDKHLPVAYLSDGQRVPEDLHPARAQDLVSRGVTLMQRAAAEHGDDYLALAFGGMLAHASA
jgi:flagellar biosynthesis protein FlhF